jgi:NAD(P)-dependent dehydrogenase (short-subunit alcohol dehydrogenase family)
VDLKDRVAVVTGGGRGIGRGICLALASRGPRAVVVNYAHSETEALETAAEVTAAGSEGVALRADVTDDASARSLVRETVDRFGRLDVLVNNAGAARVVPLADLEAVSDELWDEILGVNLFGTFYCCRAAHGELAKQHGLIVNIVSMSAHRGVSMSIPYSVSKAGVLQLTRLLAVALAPNVRVNSISPGAVNTGLFRDFFGEEAADEHAERFGATTPLGRTGLAKDVGDAVVALALADHLTGQDLILDGGKHLLY